MSIVLASASPRRQTLLEKAGISFEVVVSSVEEVHDSSMKPEDLCELNARLKAESVAEIRQEATVIGADTLVFLDGEPIGKPADMEEAYAMLRKLSGRTHRVCTGVCVIFPGEKSRVFHECSDVEFLPLDDEKISNYFSLVNPLDKAGAYGIQQHGGLIIKEIQGSFENVMGLPVEPLLKVLEREG